MITTSEKNYTFLSEIKTQIREQKRMRESFASAYEQTKKEIWYDSYIECDKEITYLECLLFSTMLNNIYLSEDWTDKDIKTYIKWNKLNA